MSFKWYIFLRLEIFSRSYFSFTDGSLISVPVSKESMAFFGLQQVISDNDETENSAVNFESGTSVHTQSFIQHGMNFQYIIFLL